MVMAGKFLKESVFIGIKKMINFILIRLMLVSISFLARMSLVDYAPAGSAWTVAGWSRSGRRSAGRGPFPFDC